MLTKKRIWNSTVIFAILFLIFMFGANKFLGPSPHFAAIPKPPRTTEIPLATIKAEVFSADSQGIFAINKAGTTAVAWVVTINAANINMTSGALLEKLQNQKLAAFIPPFPAPQQTQLVFVGPYVKKQQAEQVADKIKKVLGLSVNVVRFDPL